MDLYISFFLIKGVYHFADLVVWGGGPDFVFWDFCDFFSPLGMILSIFLENSVKSGVYFARLTYALPPLPSIGEKKKKIQKNQTMVSDISNER